MSFSASLGTTDQRNNNGPFAAGVTQTNFTKTRSIMLGYNIKNTRNGKIILTMGKWLSLRPLACKSKFIQ